jgi:hypothetical protein
VEASAASKEVVDVLRRAKSTALRRHSKGRNCLEEARRQSGSPQAR